MGQGLANVTALPICCMQDSSNKAQVLKTQPSLASVNLQSRNLQHENWEVRAEAADFFGRLGPESVILAAPALQDLLLKDEAWRVRKQAAEALQDLGSEAVSLSAKALQKASKEDGHYTVRLAAANALRKFGHRGEAALPLRSQDAFTFTQDYDNDFLQGNQVLDEAVMMDDKRDELQAKLEAMEAELASSRAKLQSLQAEKKAALQQDSATASRENSKPDKAASATEGAPSDDTRMTSLGDISEISVVSAPREHAIVVERGSSGKWGIDVDFVMHGTCLRVSRIEKGAIRDWNKENPDSAVEVGDLLVELNGVSRSSNELVKVICKASRLEMTVQKGS